MRVVQKQIQLPLRKAIEIAARSLRIRLTRSILTLITIIMAIAFLTNVWATSALEPVIQTASDAAKGLVYAPVTGSMNRTVWLISLSLLVCMVGITNAMLMSVMERYREIGTMKCLGALDSFILKLFLLESLFLGAVGTLAGVAIGLGLTFLILLNRYGSGMWSYLPWDRLPLIVSVTLFIGMAITTGAALYPARKAARMEPIAAMRVDV